MSNRDRRQAPTLAEVARAAGVSSATASKALNGRYGVNPGTRERVLQVAADLGFTPNLPARGLIFGRSGSVGLLTTDIEGRFVSQIMAGVEQALLAEGSLAIMANAGGSEARRDQQIAALLSRRVDGIILVGRAPEPVPHLPRRPPVPIAYAYAPSDGPDDVSLVADMRQAGRIAAEHLVAIGCRRIAHIGGPYDTEHGWTSARDRAAGTLDALALAGLPLEGGHPRFGAYTEAWGWQALGELVDEGFRPDGIVCANDQIAKGAILRAQALGMVVPHDVAVVGFDNWGPVAETALLPQTSVDACLTELGAAAARVVLDPDSTAPGTHLVAPRLVVRETTRRV